MRHTLRLIVVVLATILLQGCPPPQAVGLFNNTGQDLVLHLRDGTEPWPNGAYVRFSDKDSGWDQLYPRGETEKAPWPELTVAWPSKIQKYALTRGWMPEEYRRFAERFLLVARVEEVMLQLEPDGNLYPLRADQSPPVTEFDRQQIGHRIEPY